MPDKRQRAEADELSRAFTLGFSRASSSLSVLIKEKVYFNSVHFGFHELNHPSGEHELLDHIHAGMLITTEIFGDLLGKSYLLLTKDESDVLTGTVPESKDARMNIREEFLKELDNILSAAVVSELANEFNLKVYGDVPRLTNNVRLHIKDLVADGLHPTAGEIYLTAVRFSFNNQLSMGPHFIWALDTDSLGGIEPRSAL